MITSKELDKAILDNDGKVNVAFDGKIYTVSVTSAAQDEADFTVPGLPGEFKVHEIGRDSEEPGTYNYIYSYGEQFFALFGSYDSWNGTDLYDDEFTEVEPAVITVKVWRSKR